MLKALWGRLLIILVHSYSSIYTQHPNVNKLCAATYTMMSLQVPLLLTARKIVFLLLLLGTAVAYTDSFVHQITHKISHTPSKNYHTKYINGNRQLHRLYFDNNNIDKNSGDRDYNDFGPVSALAKNIDKWTGGWGLFYADVSPYTEKSTVGLVFLATNIIYLISGYYLYQSSQYVYSTAIDVAGLLSINYHFHQLKYGPNQSIVRLTLLLDYFAASIAILISIYTFTQYMSVSAAVPYEYVGLGRSTYPHTIST